MGNIPNMSKQTKLSEMIQELTDNWVDYLEIVKLQAEYTREKYLALIEQGFNEKQALYLCKEGS